MQAAIEQEKTLWSDMAPKNPWIRKPAQTNEPEYVPPPEKGPRRLWETDKIFRCPLMGMCLSLSEQKLMLKKAKVSLKDLSHYDIHEILIGSCENENRLSRKVENLLNRKYGIAAAPLRELHEKKFMEQWDIALKRGEYEGFLWAAATRWNLSVKNRTLIFGAVHMAMHFTAQEAAKLSQRLARAEDEIARLQNLSRDSHKANKSLREENLSLTTEIENLRSKVSMLEQENADLSEKTQAAKVSTPVYSLEQERDSLRAEHGVLSSVVREKDRFIDQLQNENQQLVKTLSQQEDSQENFLEQAREMIDGFFKRNRCDDSCPSFNLCQKRVLIVGGITKMESLYRDLVERGGGVFEYHDGYVKSGTKDLENRLKRSDVVLCPVNCNSHGACSMVKNLGKKHNIPVHMLASSSLSSVSQTIYQIAN